MKRTVALLSLGGLLLFPATPALAAGEPIVAAVIDLGQAGNAGNGFSFVNGRLSLTNRGNEPVEVLEITSSVALPKLGLAFDLPPSGDLAYNPVLDPGERGCYGLGGEFPRYPDTSLLLIVRVTLASAAGPEVRELIAGGYDRSPGGLVGGGAPQGEPFTCN